MAAHASTHHARKPELSSKAVGKIPATKPTHGSRKAVNLEMANRFGRWLSAQRYASSTQDRYCRIAQKLCAFIGPKALSSVTPMDVGDYLTQTLPDRWADNYISDQLGALRCFFDFLYLGGVVDSVAPRFLRARARTKALPRALTEAQVRRLIRAAAHPRDRALIELLYSTGCRIGEVRTLRVEDIDFRARRFLVRGKRKERIVYFGKHASTAIRHYLDGRKAGYLFQDKIEPQEGYITYYKKAWIGNWKDYTESGGGVKRSKWLGSPSVWSYDDARKKFRKFLRDKETHLVRHKPDRPMNRSSLSTVIREIGRKAGIKKVSPHALRHSFATHILERGGDIRALQELLGHTYLTSTQVYAKISNRAVRTTFRRFHPRG